MKSCHAAFRGVKDEPRAEKTEDGDSGQTAALRDLPQAEPEADHDAGAVDLFEVSGEGGGVRNED